MGEEQCLSSLGRVKLLFKVFMISVYDKGVQGALKPMSLFFQCQLYTQQFSVPHVIVTFGWCFLKKPTGCYSGFSLNFCERTTLTPIGFHLNYEGFCWIWVSDDWGLIECFIVVSGSDMPWNSTSVSLYLSLAEWLVG